MNVAGTLTLADEGSITGMTVASINTGTIVATGDVIAVDGGKHGNAVIRIADNSSQTITGSALAEFPSLEIASTGGTVTLSGTLVLSDDFTYTSGVVSAGASVVQFQKLSGGTAYIIPGTMTFNDVEFVGNSAYYNLSNGTLKVGGNLTLADQGSAFAEINDGTFQVTGNFTASSYGYDGGALIQFVGTSSSTVTVVGSAQIPNGDVTVNKTGGGNVTLASDVFWNSVVQDLSVTSGTILMSGHNLTVDSTLNLSAGTSVTKGGGTLTVNGAAIPAGSYSGGTIF